MNSKDLATFQAIVKQLLKAEKSHPAIEPVLASQLEQTLDLSLQDEALDDQLFSQQLEELVMHTPKTASSYFFNQLYGGRRSRAVLGDLLASFLNNSMYTYKIGGPMVGVEKTIIRKICELINYPSEADGTIAAGGSMSNLMAMIMARDFVAQQVIQKGVQQPMVLYTSIESHFSIAKNASLMGVGREQVRFIESDSQGKMRPDQLEATIKDDLAKGLLPFMVNATAGTTVLGAFDPIEAISDICQKHQLWLHVDGAYCGGVIFSQQYKKLISGIEKADSFSINAHKMLGTPLTCSILVSKHPKQLHYSFSSEADYLYQTDNDELNPGKTSLQCGRRNDGLKLWTLWKSIGTSGMEKMIDHQFALADFARKYVSSHPDYELLSFENSISICFNYKHIPARKLCSLLYEKGSLMVSFGSFKGKEFVRLVTINSDNQEKEITGFFATLEKFVEEHSQELIALKSTNPI
jgi:sulfinoalanine decarboxylase/sulfinoalanine decarboxylase/aspartate 1-decarboxylase